MAHQSCLVEIPEKSGEGAASIAAFICVFFRVIYVMCYFDVYYFCHVLSYYVSTFRLVTCHWKCVWSFYTYMIFYVIVVFWFVLFRRFIKQTRLVGSNEILIASMSLIVNLIDTVVIQIKDIIILKISFHWRQINNL